MTISVDEAIRPPQARVERVPPREAVGEYGGIFLSKDQGT